MNTDRTVERRGPFWEGAFLVAYRELLRRQPPSDQVLPGARIAALACSMADDCVRERIDTDGACPACIGVGCEACRFTGNIDSAEGLHAPKVVPALSLVSGQADGTSETFELKDAIDIDDLAKRRERIGGGSADVPE